jgi:AcrR family transcriptional regulator
MPRSRESTHRRILDAAYLLFRARGYVRVSIDDIAAAAIVTKRTLYRHFKSKDIIVGEVLEAQHRLALTTSRTLSHSPQTADELIDVLFSEIAAWSASSRWEGSGFSRAAIELADLPGHPARAIARRHKTMLETHVANQLKRLNIAAPVERARQIWLLAEGAMVSVLVHQDQRYVQIAARTARGLLQHRRGQAAGTKGKSMRRPPRP